MDGILRHRQTKRPETDRPSLNHRATSRLYIRNKPARPPRPIGKTRHTIGVILFFASFLPYPFVVAALMFLHPTGRDIHYLVAALLAGDGIFITSLFVLGGEFWERLKRLFEWPGKQQAA